MRLGLVSSSYPLHPGDSRNAGVFVRAFALALERRGHRVSILIPRRAGTQGADPEIRTRRYGLPEPAASLTHLDVWRPDHLLRLAILLGSGFVSAAHFGRLGRFDHLLAFWALPSGILARRAAARAGCGYSVWALGSDIWKAARYPGGVRSVKAVLGGADRLYADGLELARDVKRLSGREVAFLASSRLLPLGPPRSDWADGRKHLLFLGRFHPNKGPDLLLEAIAALPARRREGLRVHMHGEGPLEAELRATVDAEPELRRCVEIGKLLDAPGVAAGLRAAHAVVIPSRIESIPVVLSDALQCDAPAVVTAVGDMGRLVERFDAGIAAAEASPAAIAAAIERILDRPRDSFQGGIDLLWRELNLDTSVDTFLRDVAPGEEGGGSA